ncbi:ATP-binding protein [Myxococcus sp. K15C18031901]|uniref:sensor histidine kinase n=1 Tax=Myxococcus dinghuensis TaxID=2906761 RepID=UPI0020A7A8B5|nr:ATP-binding protein [Myxococcus dinghuensis]MCP3103478.1 ATP-binding protein [Myxococcus dinghuensis]
MRISTKLGLGLTLTSAVILGSYGYSQLQKEEMELRTATEQASRLLATALQVAMENAVRDGQSGDVGKMLESLELKDPTVDVLVFDAKGALVARSLGSSRSLPLVEAEAVQVMKAHGVVTRFGGEGGLDHLSIVLPLHNDTGGSLGAVGVVKPLDGLRLDLESTRFSTLLSTLTLIVGISAVGWLLMLLYIQRPLERMVGAMRAVRGGDFTTSVVAERDDEVGEVAHAFNAMVKELGEARGRLTEEVEARIALEAGLQRVDKLVTLGQLSAGLAHEIGSPLLILGGRAQALAARTELPEDVRRNANILVEQSERIARTVRQLLDLSRRKPTRRDVLDVAAPVRAVVDLLEHEARKRDVRLVSELAPSLPRVFADGDGVQQVALNLLTNALRATSRGGTVRLALAPANFRIAPSLPERAGICLSVEDTGVGIDAERVEHIFEPFFSTWSEQGGTGLGLAVVKSIVNEHGGTMAVSSRPGEGSLFQVFLPVAGEAESKEVVA